MITFQKYHGTGNDFILIDDRNSNIQLDTEQIKKMCDRHFGIGADGLILIRPIDGYDFEMAYYNSDGNRSSMCGNGGRCSVGYALDLGIISGDTKFLAFDGGHEAKITSLDPLIISLRMSDVPLLEINERFIWLDTGSPHYVQFRDDVETMDVYNEGRSIRYNDRFRKDGTNVNFVQPAGDSIFVRTYERGVEGETLSCGTGVTASVLASVQKGIIKSSPGKVKTPGGDLLVHFKENGKGFSDVWLEGAVSRVFYGVYR